MRPIKRAIILCWIMLVACFAIKLFGGNWFEVVCTNEHFSNLCDYVNSTKIVYETISFFLYVIPSVFMILSIARKPIPEKKDFFVILFSIIAVWCSKFVSHNLKSVLEFLNAVVTPILINKTKEIGFGRLLKKTWYYGLIGNALVLLLQVISLTTRNIDLKIITGNFLLSSILLVDYYIMIVLYYLYTLSTKKEKKENG